LKLGFLQTRPLLKSVNNATIVLPELFNTGYLFRNNEELKELAESASKGYTVQTIKKVAVHQKLNLVFGIAEVKSRKYYNTAVVISSSGRIYTYQKVHLFDREKLFFQPGTKSFPIISVNSAKLGVMICFDWIYPEVARVLALNGAQIICQPANLILPWCQDAMRVRAIENRVFTVTANRIGTEKRGSQSLSFSGRSQIVDPSGEILADASERSEALRIVEIDVSEAQNKHITPNNDIFQDRRVPLYRSILSKNNG
jgi:predicted amidohydrolase